MNPSRKNLRLQDYDYSAPGCYFLTFCTQDKGCILSNILPGAETEHARIRLTEPGQIVAQLIQEQAPLHGMHIFASVVMPNHVHILLESDGTHSLGKYIGAVKSLTTYRWRQQRKGAATQRFWQRNYYDHVIRNQEDLLEKWKYIEENPDKWILGERM